MTLNYMVKYDARDGSVDVAAGAIASAPRRRMVERLVHGPASMSELAEHLEITLPGVDKHLRVLLDAGIVAKSKRGRSTVVTLNPGSLHELATWAMSTRLMWAGMLDRYAATVADRPSEDLEDQEPR
jgi:DNA-binding transcriptional ArsR family regulator